MSTWQLYSNQIKRNCGINENAEQDVTYWSNDLFAGTIIFILPFCLIALIPSLYWIISNRQYVVAAVDLLTVFSMITLAFAPGISINNRKKIFITCVYIFSLLMLYFIGLMGPGVIFLLMACVLATLIFPGYYPWWPAILNTVICILFGAIDEFNLLPVPNHTESLLANWIAASSNLAFLSFLSVALIPRLFRGLQLTILKEKKLQHQLAREQQSLQTAMDMLEQKNSDLEQFAYAASHDLQEPLRMVTSFLTLLENKYKSLIDDKGKKYIHFAVDGAKRMRQMITDLLEFSRAGRTKEMLEQIDMEDLIREIKLLYQNKMEEKNATLTTMKLPVIYTYKSPVKQLLQNLVSNALKYSKSGSQVDIMVSLAETETHWQFTVSDNGIGIAAEYYERIFILFQRLHSREEYSGTGIGLAVCKKISESLGGKIWVTSQEEKGSTFYFTILKNYP